MSADRESEQGGKVVHLGTPPPGQPGGGGLESRVSILETHLPYLATKSDVKDVKIWVLAGVIAGIGIATTIAVGVALAVVRWILLSPDGG